MSITADSVDLAKLQNIAHRLKDMRIFHGTFNKGNKAVAKKIRIQFDIAYGTFAPEFLANMKTDGHANNKVIVPFQN